MWIGQKRGDLETPLKQITAHPSRYGMLLLNLGRQSSSLTQLSSQFSSFALNE